LHTRPSQIQTLGSSEQLPQPSPLKREMETTTNIKSTKHKNKDSRQCFWAEGQPRESRVYIPMKPTKTKHHNKTVCEIPYAQAQLDGATFVPFYLDVPPSLNTKNRSNQPKSKLGSK
jgi:hypothetical protein